jgi:ABC-type oligopeptide transport system substrate-binding subunit
MKKILCLVLCLAFCLSVLAGCGLKGDEKGANVRVYLSDYPYTLDPAVIQLNSDVEQLLYMIFEPLTMIDEKGKVQPALAEEWYYKYDEIYQEHKMYFELKETRWNDNRPVTADDVIYAWRRILLPETDSPYASLLYPIKGARTLKSGLGTIDDLGLAAVDDTLLEVTFEYEYNVELFAEQVANVHLSPCREDIVTRYTNEGEDWAGSATNIVCNGPFRVQTMDMPRAKRDDGTDDDYSKNFSCKLVLERNAYYMRDPKDDKLDKYVTPYRITCLYFEGEYSYYEDERGNTQKVFQADLYDMGDIHYLSSFEKETYERYTKKLKTERTLNGFSFYFNTAGYDGDDLLTDANVRKALSASLDREAIVADVTGTGEVAATGYVPYGVFDADRKSDFREVGGDLYNFDMDAAKELKSGKRGSLTITYLIPVNEYTMTEYPSRSAIKYDNIYESIAKAAGSYWTDLGFSVDYKGLYPEEYTQALINRDYEIIGVNTSVGSVDAFAYLAPFAKEFSGAGIVVNNEVTTDEETFATHYTNIDDADYSELINKILYTSDRKERATLLHEAEEMLVNELCPATMVFWYTRSYVADKNIKGLDDDNWFGYVDMTGLKLKNWRKLNETESAAMAERG